jgi:hypothetical protein
MSKNYLLIKKIKKKFLSTNKLIESYFDKLKFFRLNYKKILLNKDNRVFFVFVTVIFLTLIYFLLPTFYNKDIIQAEIKSQIFKKYNINIKFNKKINYGLLPKPHFVAKDVIILANKKPGVIGVAKNFRIFISVDRLLRFNSINIKDLHFKKTDFIVSGNDLSFFKNLLKTEPNENKIIIKNSNIFFENDNDEIVFLNKIIDSKFYYDSKKLQNILTSSNEIFKVPFKLNIKNDRFNKKVFSNFNSKKIRLSLKNETNYDQEFPIGLLNILFINKSTSLSYEFKKRSFNFNSGNNSYLGEVFFKPFYFVANFNYEGISFKNLFDKSSILFDLIKSEIFNNPNLNIHLNFNIKDITNINELNNLLLKVVIEEGLISFIDSSIMWKDDLIIQIKESVLNYDDDQINIIGKITIDIKDKDDFYSSYQVKKIYRKDIKKIEFDFFYNLNEKNISFDNVKIDELSNTDLDRFINNFNSKNTKLNRITLKNFIGNLFSVYAG